MGKNAYINFYMWYYNEHRGQAPMTKIAKNAGICWRKMSPSEKEKFNDMDLRKKHKLPMYISAKKLIFKASKPTGKRQAVERKAKKKSHRKRGGTIGHKRKKKLMPNIQPEQNIHKREWYKLKTGSTKQRDDINDDRAAEKQEKDKADETSVEGSESEEEINRRRSIQRWMDENHYT